MPSETASVLLLVLDSSKQPPGAGGRGAETIEPPPDKT